MSTNTNYHGYKQPLSIRTEHKPYEEADNHPTGKYHVHVHVITITCLTLEHVHARQDIMVAFLSIHVHAV